MRGPEVVDRFSTLVDPLVADSARDHAAHGDRTDEMWPGRPCAEAAVARLVEFVGGRESLRTMPRSTARSWSAWRGRGTVGGALDRLARARAHRSAAPAHPSADDLAAAFAPQSRVPPPCAGGCRGALRASGACGPRGLSDLDAGVLQRLAGLAPDASGRSGRCSLTSPLRAPSAARSQEVRQLRGRGATARSA